MDRITRSRVGIEHITSNVPGRWRQDPISQITVQIADQMGTPDAEFVRLLALVNVAMADAGIAIWESKFYYDLWRPITGIREADRGTGPPARGDGNYLTRGDVNFSPLGAPASNLQGPNFTPPFPAYPSGHAGFGGALFQILRRFYGTDEIAFRFVSDEFNGKTVDNNGNIRPLIPRSFETLSEAEEENGQSRIYLRIHWSFDKTAQPSARPAVPASAQAVERVSHRRHSSEKSLAVLPMQNFSADSRHDYFADGLTEALIANLAQVNGLRVTSRTSSMHYKGQRKPLPQIARELDVHMIIEGSTVTQGDRLRVTAQLIEADTDEHLWAKTYDRPLRDILTVQADIAAAVARDVQGVLSRP